MNTNHMIHELILPGATSLYYSDDSSSPERLKSLYDRFVQAKAHGDFLSWLMELKTMHLIGSSNPGVMIGDIFTLPANALT